jgi:hypothetical protein
VVLPGIVERYVEVGVLHLINPPSSWWILLSCPSNNRAKLQAATLAHHWHVRDGEDEEFVKD